MGNPRSAQNLRAAPAERGLGSRARLENMCSWWQRQRLPRWPAPGRHTPHADTEEAEPAGSGTLRAVRLLAFQGERPTGHDSRADTTHACMCVRAGARASSQRHQWKASKRARPPTCRRACLGQCRLQRPSGTGTRSGVERPGRSRAACPVLRARSSAHRGESQVGKPSPKPGPRGHVTGSGQTGQRVLKEGHRAETKAPGSRVGPSVHLVSCRGMAGLSTTRC